MLEEKWLDQLRHGCILNYKKYEIFVKNNPEIKNPNDFTITYSVIDSDGVKVQIYNITISDIAFLF